MATAKSQELEAQQHRGRHGSEEAQEIAEGNTILRMAAGSVVHGTSSGTGDRDEAGVCIPPPQYVLGLRKIAPFDGFWRPEYFEMYQHHTAWEREGGIRNRSGEGDLDLTIYSLRHFAALALEGNPSITAMFFTPDEHVTTRTVLGTELLELAPKIISKQCAPRFTGYLKKQRESMMSHHGGGGRDVSRPELVEEYGYDVKFAAHMIRLGCQGVELLETGRISLPMRENEREIVTGVRAGKWGMKEALAIAKYLEDRIERLTVASALPEHPDRDYVNGWLADAHHSHWLDNWRLGWPDR